MPSRLTDWAARTPALEPARAIRRRLMAIRYERDANVVRRLQSLLAEDPVLHVAEFEGDFQLGATSHLLRRIVMDGAYEPVLSGLCRSYVDPHRDAVDVGANAGFFSVLFARLLVTRRVLAIEPSAAILPRLRANVERNGVAGRVSVIACALSDEDGEAELHAVKGLEEYATIGHATHPSLRDVVEKSHSHVVETTTLDRLVETHRLDPGFVKVDVEGAEALVFGGAQQTLEHHRPVVLSELDDALLRGNGSSAAEVLALFHASGYRTIDPHRGVEARLSAADRLTEVLCLPSEIAGA